MIASVRAWWRASIMSLILLLALSAAPAAARPLAAIRAEGTLRVGLTGDYAPYALRDPDGKLTGADVMMARALADALRGALTIVPATQVASNTTNFSPAWP